MDPTKCENPVESLDSDVEVSKAEPSHLDLTNCESVAYEMKDGVPGVKFTVEGSDGWTPVRKRRCRPKSKLCSSSDSEGSSSLSYVKAASSFSNAQVLRNLGRAHYE